MAESIRRSYREFVGAVADVAESSGVKRGRADLFATQTLISDH